MTRAKALCRQRHLLIAQISFLLTGLLLFLLSTPIEARDEYTEDPFQAFLDRERVSCLQEILFHPYTKAQYPALLTEKRNDQNFKMLTEIDEFCGCTIKKRTVELKLKKKRPMEWYFLDRKKRLGMEDQCAMAKLGDQTMNLYFTIVVSTRIRGGLENRLSQRQPASIRLFASTQSYAERMNCLQSEILRRCTRIKSLRNTYQCIEDITGSGNELQTLEEGCPPLVEKENQEGDKIPPSRDRDQFI